jgi:hypothetical protein
MADARNKAIVEDSFKAWKAGTAVLSSFSLTAPPG